MATVKGIWIFKDTLTYFSGREIVNFTSAGETYLGFEISSAYSPAHRLGYIYNMDVEDYWRITEEYWFEPVSELDIEIGWELNSSKTIDFGETEQTVSDEFYEWFVVNTVPPTIEINITKNGTTTLATAGKYCDKNIDIKVNIKNKDSEIVSGSITDYVNDEITKLRKGAFYSCTGLKTVDFSVVSYINTEAFRYCYRLNKVVLRNPSVCTLGNTAAFSGCYHLTGTQHNTYNPKGLKDCYIFVPDELVEDYKVTTNWLTYADQIKPISELE